MGQLRTSLENATKLVVNLLKTAENYGNRLNSLGKQADSFVKGGFAGMDELFLYISEKLKKNKIEFDKVKTAQVKTVTDANIKRYLAGIQFVIVETSKFATEFDAIAADTSVDAALAALGPAFKSIEDQIKKKKKKLLQSKKFKTKIAGYEATLEGSRKLIANMQRELAEFRRIKPPSANRIRSLLFATDETKLSELKTNLSGDRKKLYDDYNSILLKLNQSSGEIREEDEFAGVMKAIKQMINEADEMEKEGT